MTGSILNFSADTQALLNANEVATFNKYSDALNAVDKLSEAGFPVTSLAIIGNDVLTLERIVGKLNAGRVFLEGLMSGLWLGLLAAVMVSLVGQSQPNKVFMGLLVVAMGLLSGVMRVLVYVVSSRRRGFASTKTVLAQSFRIVTTFDAYRAREILGIGRPLMSTAAAGPTPFGSRPDEQPKFGVRVERGQASAAATTAVQTGDAPAVTAPVSDAAPTPNVEAEVTALTEATLANVTPVAEPVADATVTAAPLSSSAAAEIFTVTKAPDRPVVDIEIEPDATAAGVPEAGSATDASLHGMFNDPAKMVGKQAVPRPTWLNREGFDEPGDEAAVSEAAIAAAMAEQSIADAQPVTGEQPVVGKQSELPTRFPPRRSGRRYKGQD